MYLKKELYELIRKDERIFDFIQDGSLDGLWYWDLEHPENEWMNRRFWTVLGYNPDEMPHQSSAWQSIINQDDLKVAYENFTRHCENPDHPYDQVVRYTHKDGSTKWIRCRGLAIRDNAGKPIRMLGAHQDISDIKQREQGIINAMEIARESEEKYRAMYDNAPLSYQSLDENGFFLDINPMWLKTLGYKREEVIGQWYGDFVHPDYVEHFRKNFPAFKKQGYVSDVQFKLRRKDNTYIHVSFEGCIGYTPEGKFRQTYCVFKDITEQKALENAYIKAKERAEESEERFRLLHNASFGGIAIHNKGVILECNQGLSDMTGYSLNELIGMDGLLLIAPEHREMVMHNIATGYEKPYEASGLRKNGEQYPMRLEARNVPYKGKQVRTVEFRDVAESKEAEAALRKSEERFNLAMKASHDGLFDWNLETNDIYYSPGWKKMLGYEDHELPNDFSVWENTTAPEDVKKSWELQKKVIAGKVDRFVMEFKMRHKEGHWIDILSRAEAIFNEHGKAVRFVGTHTDISERKQAGLLLQERSEEIAVQNEELNEVNQKLITAVKKAEESDRLKSAFLANMSHEIRTPMNGILGFAELLKEPGISGEAQQAYIKIIEKSGMRMLNTINEIVDISKIEAGMVELSLAELNINELIDEINAFFKAEADSKKIGLSCIKSLSQNEAILTSDREKVFAIVTNLVKNALKFTREGSIEFGYHLHKGSTTPMLVFYVKDTGIGIPAERREAIFERFIQADIADKMAYQGAGLGLAIAKAYTEMLGGQIWVRSTEGAGSTFFFTLPFAAGLERPENEMQPVSAGEIAITKKLKILVAEDEEDSELLINRFLVNFSKEILKAKTGLEAVELCRDNPDIDLVLMDVKMPGMGGYEATKAIRSFNREVIIIAQTAYGLSGDRERALEAGCNDYIAKPLNRKSLLTKIAQHFAVASCFPPKLR